MATVDIDEQVQEAQVNEDEIRTREILNWDKNHKEKTAGKVPDAKYGAFSESLRHKVPESKACSMFCGGQKCKYCNPVGFKWTPEQMEVKGLYSNWITDNILAMSRPTTKAIEEFDIIKQFKNLGIKSIINLQLPGEHTSCGFGNEAEGFSYSPQLFMDNDVFYYNFGWQDYGVGSLTNILDMVKVMQFALSEGKVAVHCHAGLGRTGVLIACYLVYANRMNPHDVIHYIRSKRRPSVQTRSQIECVCDFSQFLVPLRVIFSYVSENSYDFTLAQFLVRQKQMLHGEESRKLRHVPKVVFVCCERLLELANRGHHHDFHSHDTLAIMRETAPNAFYNNERQLQHSMSHNAPPASTSSSHHQHTTAPPLKSVLFDSNLNVHMSVNRSMSRESFTALNVSRRSTSSLSQTSLTAPSETDGDESLLGTPTESEMDLSLSNTMNKEQRLQLVAGAMAKYEYTSGTTEKVLDYQKRLNEDDNGGFLDLGEEGDPSVVSAIMWEWLDQLKQPMLHPQDMPAMLELCHDPVGGLKLLEKGTSETIQVLFGTVARLLPLPDPLLEDVFCRMLSTLTHQNMVLDSEHLMQSTGGRASVQRTSNPAGLMRSNVADRLMVFFHGLVRILSERITYRLKHRRESDIHVGLSGKTIEEDSRGEAETSGGRKKWPVAAPRSSVTAAGKERSETDIKDRRSGGVVSRKGSVVRNERDNDFSDEDTSPNEV